MKSNAILLDKFKRMQSKKRVNTQYAMNAQIAKKGE